MTIPGSHCSTVPGPFQEHALGADAVFYTVLHRHHPWALYGYSLAFTVGSDFIAASRGLPDRGDPDSRPRRSVAMPTSRNSLRLLQMTFAADYPASSSARSPNA